MPEDRKTVDPVQVSQISPPVYPDGMVLRLNNGIGHLIFVTVPNPAEPRNLTIIADIVCQPSFLLTIAENCLGALKIYDPAAELNADRVEMHRANLSAAMIEPSYSKGEE